MLLFEHAPYLISATVTPTKIIAVVVVVVVLLVVGFLLTRRRTA